ncbi:hypothetical protein ASE73_12375 [Sphingomonas sp. Leaf24]|nr:hypothetical protein [Sphingomonas sp. Leaf24]KQM13238.1 hypothetical protein ASE50_10425 [Sphingomonas sp. Leaf5]KQM85824.1 hypothetical protein ASE73_12375 [Sphingomonas sp. Leaf24]
MRSAFLILTLIATTGPAFAERLPITTWGKPGVSFDAYRRDARECALQGGKADIRAWKPTKEVVQGVKQQELALDNTRSFHANDAIADYALIYKRRIRGNITEVQQTMVGMVETCLIGRGYREIVLDRGQERQLRKLKWGTEQRARYLHALATRPPGSS